MAISSQLLDITIDGARGILFNVTGGNSLTLFEVNQAAAIIKETAHPDVNLIFGAVVDPNMGDEIRITVIATGFDRPSVRSPLVEARPAPKKEETASFPASSPAPKAERQAPPTSPPEFQPHVINTNDLDIPAFLRNRNTQR